MHIPVFNSFSQIFFNMFKKLLMILINIISNPGQLWGLLSLNGYFIS